MKSGHPYFLTLLVICGLPWLAGDGCGEIKTEKSHRREAEPVTAEMPAEPHLQRLERLTVGGHNHQPRFNTAQTRIYWLARADSLTGFRLEAMLPDGSQPRPVPAGAAPCLSFDIPDGVEAAGLLICRITAGSTTEAGSAPSSILPHPAAWLFDPGCDVFRAQDEVSVPLRLTDRPGYDAEASFSPDARWIVYSALDSVGGRLQVMDAKGARSRTLLTWPAYVGGARFSPDGKQIVFHAARREGRASLALYLCRADGSQVRLLTGEGSYNFLPFWHPSGEYLIFCSNSEDLDFELFTIRPDGSRRERVTFRPGLDAFPAFSPDGRQLLWISQRQAQQPGQADVYKASWIP